jgi:hypothetical protein
LFRIVSVQVAGYLVLRVAILPAQDPYLSKDAPRDKPVSVTSDEQKRRFDAAIAPYIAEGRAGYPEAKRRYLAGLPPRHSFFVTVELHDSAGHSEIVFLAVDSLARDSAFGRIWNQINVVRGYRLRDPYVASDIEVMDWLIAKPDGTEEGNAVGKFLDTYRP